MKFVLTLIFTVSMSLTAFSQSDYNKAEGFIGFSHGQVDGSTFQFTRLTEEIGQTGPHRFNGFNVAGVYNLGRHVGIRGDFSATFNSGAFQRTISTTTQITGEADNSLYNGLVGVQFKDNSTDRRVKPFGYLMGGVARAITEVNSTCTGTCSPTILGFGPATRRENGFAGAFGGGIDIKLNDRFDLRAGQIDYNPVNLDQGMLHNVRIGVGIVIK
jgi:hypothetical protein